MRSSTKSALWAVTTILALGIAVAWVFGPHLFTYYMIQKMGREEPYLASIPRHLPDRSVDNSEGPTIARYGYSLEAPLGTIEKTDDVKLGTRIFFKSGQVIIFTDPARAVDRLKILKEGSAGRSDDVSNVYGAEATRSNYNLLKAVYETTPEGTSIWKPRQNLARQTVFLVMKSAEYDKSGPVYLVERGNWHGFQHGLPPSEKAIILNLFNKDNDLEVTIWVTSPKGQSSAVTQAQINRIVQTLRPAQ
jgi:hypothetical protein